MVDGVKLGRRASADGQRRYTQQDTSKGEPVGREYGRPGRTLVRKHGESGDGQSQPAQSLDDRRRNDRGFRKNREPERDPYASVQQGAAEKRGRVDGGKDTDRRRHTVSAVDSGVIYHSFSSLRFEGAGGSRIAPHALGFQTSDMAGITFSPMISRGVILSTPGTKPITVSIPIPESQRSCPINSSTFSPPSPTSKRKAQVFSMELKSLPSSSQ